MLKDCTRRIWKRKQLKRAGMFLQRLTVKVTLWLNSSAPLCSFLCFHRCLLLVVLGRSQSIRLSDWGKRWTAHVITCPGSAHKMYFLHPNFCIFSRVINQIHYPISGGALRKLCWPWSHNVLHDAWGRVHFLYQHFNTTHASVVMIHVSPGWNSGNNYKMLLIIWCYVP